MTKLNHSRYLGGETVRSQREYEREKSKPTAKQKKFYIGLKIRCEENGIDTSVGRVWTRGEYAIAIDKLIERLKEAGIDTKCNGKSATLVLHHKPDARGDHYMTTERIVIDDDPGEDYVPKFAVDVSEK